LAGSFGTAHVSYITSINKDKVPPIRVYVSSISQNKIAANELDAKKKCLENEKKL
jgi:hypothetical protein